MKQIRAECGDCDSKEISKLCWGPGEGNRYLLLGAKEQLSWEDTWELVEDGGGLDMGQRGVPDTGSQMNEIRDGKVRVPSGNREGVTGGGSGKGLGRQT